jgi:hypothetical protein
MLSVNQRRLDKFNGSKAENSPGIRLSLNYIQILPGNRMMRLGTLFGRASLVEKDGLLAWQSRVTRSYKRLSLISFFVLHNVSLYFSVWQIFFPSCLFE